MSDENLYTKILQWGYDRVDTGVTYANFEKFILELGVEVGSSRQNALFLELFDHMEKNLVPHAKQQAIRNNEFFHLNIDATFRHLERIELTEAREGSRRALLWARVSLGAAIFVGAAQIFLGFFGC